MRDDTRETLEVAEMPEDVGSSMGVDRDPVPYQAVSAAAHVAFLLLCLTLPGAAATLQSDTVGAGDRFVDLMRTPDQQDENKEADWTESGAEESGAKREGEETKAGAEDAEREDREMAVEGPPERDETSVEKKRDEKVAMEAGLAKTFEEDQLASTWGSSRESVGSDTIEAIGNLDADKKGVAQGFGGAGLEGAGRPGGGGISEKGLGTGPIGENFGDRGPPGVEEGELKKAEMGEKSNHEPEVISRPPKVTGSLDRETIRQVVRQHRREIKYCYEKQLERDPTLEGQVTMRFTISGNGKVMAAFATESNLGSPAVEQCMQQKIQQWAFPNPKRGNLVTVNYPFNFSTR